ncbi:hypothetical protein SD81_035710 [Tolypothrix campylonemoides VB511288]|nr:hypothetical protein SD81_035710 [Tolypothrix campylonemoides VB511288]
MRMGSSVILGSLSVAFATAAMPTTSEAATLAVTNCNDSGAGSLRQAVASAASGDVVDLRGLACARITLTGGAIAVPQSDLAIRGPGFNRLAISGNWRGSVFRHAGTGLLSLRGMAIEHGWVRGAGVRGGCVASEGRADLTDAHVRHCAALGGAGAHGGGVYARGGLTLTYAAVYSNRAAGDGGGLYTPAKLRVHRARVLKNSARNGGGATARIAHVTFSTFEANAASDSGGGLSLPFLIDAPVEYQLSLWHSTFAANTATGTGGGIMGGEGRKYVVNSTFTGNAAWRGAALQSYWEAQVFNSTFAWNRTTSRDAANPCGGALEVTDGTFLFVSSIAAHTTCDGAPGVDIASPHMPDAERSIATRLDVAPPEGIVLIDPMLLPLADHGGRTRVHALDPASPAIDAGTDWIGSDFDQRGDGHARELGAMPDIGAYEYDGAR